MSRPLRIEYPDAWYHVMNRGRRREKIFHNEPDYIRFINLLKESTELWEVNICAYCLMPNHYHMLLQTPQANLSRFMRHVNGIYTQRFNRSHKTDGSLFRGRYKAILIGEENYLLDLIRYIHFNPVKAKVIKHPEDHKWSSYLDYVKESSEHTWLRNDLIYEKLQHGESSIQRVKDLIKEDAPDDIYSFFKKKNLPSILGSKDFITQIKSNFFAHMVHPEIPESKQTDHNPQDIITEVAKHYNVDRPCIFTQRRGKENTPHDLAIYLTRMKTGLSLSDIGNIFSINSYSTVSNSIERIRKKIKTNKRLLESIETISKKLNKALS